MTRIVVTIDRVRLHGGAPGEREAFVRALTAELSRLLSAQAGASARGAVGGERMRETPVLRLTLAAQPGMGGARQLGRGIARGIDRAVRR